LNRKRLITILACVVALGAGGYFAKARFEQEPRTAVESTPKTATTEQRRVPVVLQQVTRREFIESLVVQGNLEAKNVALVPARVSGTIEKILVDEGDTVRAGKTKLFQIDSLKLQKAVEVQKQALAVAQCALSEKQANIERIQADLHLAQKDYERYRELHREGHVSTQAYDAQQSKLKQTRAQLKHAQALLALSVEQEEQARASLAMAQKDLRDATVYAPISGKISARYQEPGEMGNPSQPIVKIEDSSVIEVSAFLPAQHYAQVQPGKTRLRLQVYGIRVKEQAITYKSPTIDPKTRTFEVKSVIENPPEGVVPGAMAEVEVVLDRRESLGVPTVALQRRGGRPVVFLVENDTAHIVEVKTGLETGDWTEITGSSLKEHARVTTMGQFLLKEGTAVSIQENKENKENKGEAR